MEQENTATCLPAPVLGAVPAMHMGGGGGEADKLSFVRQAECVQTCLRLGGGAAACLGGEVQWACGLEVGQVNMRLWDGWLGVGFVSAVGTEQDACTRGMWLCALSLSLS